MKMLLGCVLKDYGLIECINCDFPKMGEQGERDCNELVNTFRAKRKYVNYTLEEY